MARARQNRRTRQERSPRAAAVEHPLITQAAIPAAQKVRGEYEVSQVPNPLGEVVIGGDPRPHFAVKRAMHFRRLHQQKVIDLRTLAVLEWYAEQVAISEGGLVRSMLDVRGGGGGSASHLPISELRLAALHEIDWARRLIPPATLPVFDAVMRDNESLVETARRQCAKRYVRGSVRTQQRRAAEAFKIAASVLCVAWTKRFGARPRGIVGGGAPLVRMLPVGMGDGE